MATMGTVRFWHADRGWGVLDAIETPGGCWAHYTQIQTDADTAARGFRALSDGQPVEFTWEEYSQDGYDFRAIAVWPCAGTA